MPNPHLIDNQRESMYKKCPIPDTEAGEMYDLRQMIYKLENQTTEVGTPMYKRGERDDRTIGDIRLKLQKE